MFYHASEFRANSIKQLRVNYSIFCCACSISLLKNLPPSVVCCEYSKQHVVKLKSRIRAVDIVHKKTSLVLWYFDQPSLSVYSAWFLAASVVNFSF